MFSVGVSIPPDSCASVSSPEMFPRVFLEDVEVWGEAGDALDGARARLAQLRLDEPLQVGVVYRHLVDAAMRRKRR